MIGIRKWVGTVILLSVCPIGIANAFADQIVIQGSSTFNRQIIEPFQPAIETLSKHKLSVIPNRTALGVVALMEGRAQMAMISAPLLTEVAALQKQLPGLAYDKLKAHEILNTRIAVVVNKTNAVRKLSLDQIKKVLTGDIKNWSEIGGDNIPIRVVFVGAGGGVTSTVEAAVLDGQRISAANVLYVKTAVQLTQVVEQEPTALGFGQLLLVQQRGIPEVATDRPIEQRLSIVTLGDPSPVSQSVIDAMRVAVGKSM